MGMGEGKGDSDSDSDSDSNCLGRVLNEVLTALPNCEENTNVCSYPALLPPRTCTSETT